MFRRHWWRLLRRRRHGILFKGRYLNYSLRTHHGNYWCRHNGYGDIFRGIYLRWALWRYLILIWPNSDHMVVWFWWFSLYFLLIILIIKPWTCHHCWTFFELGHFMHSKTNRLFFAIISSYLMWRIRPFSFDTFFIMSTGRLFTFHSILIARFTRHKFSFRWFFLIQGLHLSLFQRL